MAGALFVSRPGPEGSHPRLNLRDTAKPNPAACRQTVEGLKANWPKRNVMTGRFRYGSILVFYFYYEQSRAIVNCSVMHNYIICTI